MTSSRANVLVPPAFHVTLGMKMKMGEVAAVRDHSAATDKVQPGDKIMAAGVTAGGASLLELPESRALPALGASTAGLLGSPQGQGSLLAASALTPGRADSHSIRFACRSTWKGRRPRPPGPRFKSC